MNDVFTTEEIKLLDKLFKRWARRVTIPTTLIGLVRVEMDNDAPELIHRWARLYYEHPSTLVNYAKKHIERANKNSRIRRGRSYK